jgi:hypothetical protein
MQHPFIDNTELAKLSIDEIGKKITDLTDKLNFASRSRNAPMVYQLQMVLENYRAVYSSKMDELFKKQNSQNQINIEGSK